MQEAGMVFPFRAFAAAYLAIYVCPSTSYAGHHFYTSSLDETQSLQKQGWTLETPQGFGFVFATSNAPKGTTALYRLSDPNTGDHLYTVSSAERISVIVNLQWRDEGAVGFVWPTKRANTVPLYRLFSASQADHFYTHDAAEAANAADFLGYEMENGRKPVAWLAAQNGPGTLPLYRLFRSDEYSIFIPSNPRAFNHHFYTTSRAEAEWFQIQAWKIEGQEGNVFGPSCQSFDQDDQNSLDGTRLDLLDRLPKDPLAVC
jgi:hypothetical protein